MNNRKATQAAVIKSALLAGSSVNSVTAFSQGITRLAAVIKRLRDSGLPILTERDHHNGLARYRLPEDWQPKPDQTTNPIETGQHPC